MKEERTNAPKKKSNGAKKRGIRRAIFSVILVLEILVIALLSAGFYALSKWDKIEHVTITKKEVVVNEQIDEEYLEEISKGYTNLAVLGVDGDGYNCDVIIICSINEDTGEVRMASVYRDTVVQMEDGTYRKVNAAISYGNNYGTSQINVLNLNLDLNIDQYVVVNWTSVARAINWFGGVDVTVTEAMMREINGYITDTVKHITAYNGTVQLTSAGYQHLDGIQAVAYMRLRHQDSDRNRTQRQREVISQILDKAKVTPVSTLIGMIDDIFPLITTTFDLPEVIALASDVNKYYIGQSVGFPFYEQSVTNWRAPGDWPLFATNLTNNVAQLHEYLYGTKNYEPSLTVQRISDVLEAECGLGVPETTPFSFEQPQ